MAKGRRGREVKGGGIRKRKGERVRMKKGGEGRGEGEGISGIMGERKEVHRKGEGST